MRTGRKVSDDNWLVESTVQKYPALITSKAVVALIFKARRVAHSYVPSRTVGRALSATEVTGFPMVALMKTLAKGLSGVAAGVTLSLAVVCDVPAWAATLTGTFQVDITSSFGTPLASSTYFGTYSFDNTNLSGTQVISPVDGGLKLKFDFVNLSDASLSQTYTEKDDIAYSDFPPQLTISSGTITGLNYLVATALDNFSIDGSSFLYRVSNLGSGGEGLVKYSVPKSGTASVPESSPVLGLVMLGLGGVAHYKKSKKQQNRYPTLF